MGYPLTLKRSAIAIAVTQAMVLDFGHAASITVNNGGDARNGCTFREAVAIINAGNNQSNGCNIDTRNDRLGVNDIIKFNVAGDSISLTSGEVLIDSDVSINPSGSAITINGNRTDRLLNINNANVSIDSLTLINGVSGNANNGGAIYASLSTLTINNSSISENGALFGAGGGISASRSSSVTINNSNIYDNYANGNGGGIDVSFSSTVTLNNSSVSDNFAQFCGGGVRVRINSALIVANSTITDNITYRGGGGIYSTNNGVIRLANSTVSGNEASSLFYSTDGGGIDARSSTVTLNDTTVSGNYAVGGGGVNAESSTVTLSNSTISANSSSYNGGLSAVSGIVILTSSTISQNTATSANGGIAAVQSSLTVSNSTISGNSASSYAGGINSTESSLILTNSTISKNTALYSAGIYVDYGSIEMRNTIVAGNRAIASNNELRLNGVIVFARNNLIGDANQSLEQAIEVTQGSYGFSSPSYGNITATSDGTTPTLITNILSPLAGNGGPTQTHALVVGSPAVDTGNNTICAAAPVSNLDQRGELRPVGTNCDIGSYEGELEPALPEPESEPELFVVPLGNGNAVIFSL